MKGGFRTGAARRHLAARRAGERGTMSVEMVVIAPVLLMVVMLVVAAGRWVSAEGMAQAAARDAARAASMERSVGAAARAASASLAAADTANAACTSATDVSGFSRGGSVEVTVSCEVRLADLGLVFLPGTTTVSSNSVSPVDTWRGTR
ncbi:TadE/TadG family type IV pilus assembly protein [Actinomyces sp. MRS3W]|uniref:TadE/TadG family type IV pilus assembly protein n=1 Tax=Actinomyces sp. MRS3W TaxID=2800796 RepID=UPI0028FD430D|nr:TadE/TadG family type IV pilus assembly protein [Actinomyces sp. MRS3W]MDU0349015.1 TadE/TadG family type IV pilus assembly protein [Actinomyces sp. MRS3W]